MLVTDLSFNGAVVQFEAVHDLDVPAVLFADEGPVHLLGFTLLGLRSEIRGYYAKINV